jgi:MYXO-CTERM domain-containing protein
MRRVLALLALAACARLDGPGGGAAAIVNGTSDAGKDPAVGLVRIFNARGTQIATCTGALITPLIVLTAAHCADGSLGDTDYSVAFADAYDVRTNNFPGFIAERSVAAKWTNPNFDEKNLSNGYDLALLLLAEPAPASVPPLSIDRTRAVARGASVRMVGFGLVSAGSSSNMRIKLTATTEVTDVSARVFTVDGSKSSPCNGDSGGPALVTVGDQELVAGVVSFGDTNCDKSSGYSWVEALRADIDAFVMANDPADFGLCAADGACGFGCTLDPDCPCAADGACTTDCPDPDLDPDCPATCDADGICTRSGCPAADPDCLELADGTACSSHNDCASDLCVGIGSGTVCVPACDASGACPMGSTCSMPARACVPASGGCSVGGGGGGWLGLLLLLGLHRRRHHVLDRRQLP